MPTEVLQTITDLVCNIPLHFLQLHIINFEQLDKDGVDEFRLVSRACRALSQRTKFRTVIIQNQDKENDTRRKINIAMCKRL